ncbi:MbtH family protein [Streptomyces geysiriensis]|uniref:MbtH family protein n=1 Tax=Streptomyces geysiriensis TaxID=68207 RepID=UPI001C7D0973|nr:MbtH family NRPS accessory protein [Streptomyces geysiriensis]MBX4179036.1 MbtH family NRPS accessory protein [Streptomyces geysiriensis]
MSSDGQGDGAIYQVIVNDAQQYSMSPMDKEVPANWRKEGKTGSKDECLAYIQEVWTDMRPASG